MPEESTTTVTSPDERASNLAWWTPQRAVVGIVVLVLAVGLVMAVLNAMGITTESTGDAVGMSVLALIGVAAGTVGAYLRKHGDWQTALTAYRVAVWCLFLAFWTAVQFHLDVKREDFVKRVTEKVRQLESQDKAK